MKFRNLQIAFNAAFMSGSLLQTASGGDDAFRRGELLYQQKCMMCHQYNGQGVLPVYPPLAGSDWMAEERARTIRVLCEGLSGPITVKGIPYNGIMPAQILDDQQVADVLTYAGRSWGNGMADFSAAEVGAARGKSRYKTYEALVAASAYQPLPQAPGGWMLSEVARLPEMSVRLAGRGPGAPVYVLAERGGIYQFHPSSKSVSQIFRPDEYGISGQGEFSSSAMAVDAKGGLWVVTNQRLGMPTGDGMYMNSVSIWRSSGVVGEGPCKMIPWFNTTYPQGGGAFNHGVSHMAFGPDGLLYLNSGARTDSGESGNPPKYYPGGEVPVTACLWRMDPKAAQPEVEVIARGIRNAFGMAWDDHSRLFTVSNGPDANEPEEMDFIEQGKHYGFPYQFGNSPATKGSPYSHTPEAPAGIKFTTPVTNLGPAAGGRPGAPCHTFDPHSSPGGMIWCGADFPPLLRNSFLIARFGNLIDCPVDVGFDLISAKMEQQAGGAWQARVTTVLAPLGRPVDVLHVGAGRVLILEYTRPTNLKSKLGWLPGRILELAPSSQCSGK